MLSKIVPAIIAITIAVPAHATYIPIPNPPPSGSAPTQTRQQCYEQIHGMRIARQRAGWTREKSAQLWLKQVDQCNRIPIPKPIEGYRQRPA